LGLREGAPAEGLATKHFKAGDEQMDEGRTNKIDRSQGRWEHAEKVFQSKAGACGRGTNLIRTGDNLQKPDEYRGAQTWEAGGGEKSQGDRITSVGLGRNTDGQNDCSHNQGSSKRQGGVQTVLLGLTKTTARSWEIEAVV